MIESIIKPESVERRPWEAFIAGFLFTMTACVLVLQLGLEGESGTGFLVVSFISIAAAPFMVRMFDIEEKKQKGGNLFSRHDQLIQVFAFFFLAVILASSFFYVIMFPAGGVLFTDQIKDLCNKGIIQADNCDTLVSGHATLARPSFFVILKNNLIVLGLSFLFSFMLGAGAVFLISWNATVIGTLIGKIAENPLAYESIELVKGNIFLNYLVALPFTLLRLLPHGLFEFGGYFFGAIAGGVLSVAIVKSKFKAYKIKQQIIDSLLYLALSAGLILIGAVIEVVL